jgi:hypothetical protein
VPGSAPPLGVAPQTEPFEHDNVSACCPRSNLSPCGTPNGGILLREIEDFYDPNDNEDWSFAAERALTSFVPGNRGFTLFFRSREYRFSRTIRLIRGMSLVGSGAGKNLSGTLLRFPRGITGIVCEYPNPDTSPDRGDYSIVERLYMLGDPSSGADPGPPDPCGAAGSHGIVLHAAAILRDVAIELFGGDGIHRCASRGFTPKKPS